jgi:hypothetical protein
VDCQPIAARWARAAWLSVGLTGRLHRSPVARSRA